MTKVNLHDLKPNPTRDLKVDPIDKEHAKVIKKSIANYGFWPGVTARKNKETGELEILAGHTRVLAGIMSGIETADITIIPDCDDVMAFGIYATENQSQRGNQSTSLGGTIASAYKLVCLELLGVGQPTPQNRQAFDQGVGWRQLEAFFEKHPVHGITTNIIQNQLAALKASGDAERIAKQAQKEIEAQNKELEQELAAEAAKAEKRGDTRSANAAKKQIEIVHKKTEAMAKVVEKAKPSESGAPLIDRNVAKIIKSPSVCDTFWNLCKKDGGEYLPLNKQVEFAKHLVKKAEEVVHNGEINSRFIHEHFTLELMGAKRAQRQITKQEQENIARQSWRERQKSYQTYAAAGARAFCDNVEKMVRLEKSRPNDERLLIIGNFKTAVDDLRRYLDVLKKHGLA